MIIISNAVGKAKGARGLRGRIFDAGPSSDGG
jgi:hypothetical protein